MSPTEKDLGAFAFLLLSELAVVAGKVGSKKSVPRRVLLLWRSTAEQAAEGGGSSAELPGSATPSDLIALGFARVSLCERKQESSSSVLATSRLESFGPCVFNLSAFSWKTDKNTLDCCYDKNTVSFLRCQPAFLEQQNHVAPA